MSRRWSGRGAAPPGSARVVHVRGPAQPAAPFPARARARLHALSDRHGGAHAITQPRARSRRPTALRTRRPSASPAEELTLKRLMRGQYRSRGVLATRCCWRRSTPRSASTRSTPTASAACRASRAANRRRRRGRSPRCSSRPRRRTTVPTRRAAPDAARPVAVPTRRRPTLDDRGGRLYDAPGPIIAARRRGGAPAPSRRRSLSRRSSVPGDSACGSARVRGAAGRGRIALGPLRPR